MKYKIRNEKFLIFEDGCEWFSLSYFILIHILFHKEIILEWNFYTSTRFFEAQLGFKFYITKNTCLLFASIILYLISYQ